MSLLLEYLEKSVRASPSVDKASLYFEAKQRDGKPALKGGSMVSLEPAALAILFARV